MKPIAFVLAAFTLSVGIAPPASSQQQPSPTTATHESSARSDVEALIRQSGGDVSLAFRSLDGGQELFIQADRPFQDSLVMKIPVMIELFAQAEAQQVKMSDVVSVRNLFRSVVDSSAYTIDRADDDRLASDTGKTMTLHGLCEMMITTNSDIAANLLIERLSLEAVQNRLHILGADGMVLASGFGDEKAGAMGLKNTTTPHALMILLLMLAQNNVVSADASAQMVALLARSRLPGSIPPTATAAVVPSRGPVEGDQHDAAIIIGARSFVMVTDVRGLETLASAELVARISRALAAAI
ncbi:MAG TPA: serine hydrolase [Candidatus Acidoferrales bacterium]|nr:serine hydrolase [Candidatus Acidoferrales bacterium]